MTTTRPRWKSWQYWARLGLFGLFVLVMTIILGQIAFLHLGTEALIAPAPSSVTLPEDFPAETVTFTGGDDLTLAGWYVAPRNGAVILLLHGYDGNRSAMLWQARQLVDAGFGVLLYDLRGHGESEGEQRSFGWRDVNDVAGALDFLAGKAESIGIYGFSIGGQIALRAAAIHPEIEAIFADGPGIATAHDNPAPITLQEIFVFGLAPLRDRMIADRTGTAMPAAVVDILPEIAPRPIFYVATGQHPQIPGGEVRFVRRYYVLTQSHAEWWEIPEAWHGGGWQARPDAYAAHLIAFFAPLGDDSALD